MSVVSDISVRLAHLPLGNLLGACTDADVRLNRIARFDEGVVLYFWVSRDAVSSVSEAVGTASDADRIEVIDELEGESLIRLERESPDGFLRSFVETEAVLLEAETTADRHRLRLEFADRAALSEFYCDCVDRGVSLKVDGVHDPSASRDGHFGDPMTDAQHEAVLRAFELGYFSVPRETNLVELAESLGVSDTAVSQRLRRGLSSLVVAAMPNADGASLIDERKCRPP